jgi:uncharacterized protein YpmS
MNWGDVFFMLITLAGVFVLVVVVLVVKAEKQTKINEKALRLEGNRQEENRQEENRQEEKQQQEK